MSPAPEPVRLAAADTPAPETIPRFGGLLAHAFRALDTWLDRLYGSRWNPAHQSGPLTVALLVIFIVMVLMFLSVRVGFYAILPNVLPIVVFFGVMGWSGVLLNMGTSLIAAIALGKPEWPAAANLTPHAKGLGDWTEADFLRAMRDGKRPDGSDIDAEAMPWRAFGQASDAELHSVWLYLRSLPPIARDDA